MIETEKFDLLGLTYHQHETGQFEHYKEWFEYVLARNPKAQLLIHLPASADAVRRDLDRLNKTGDAIRTRFHATVVVPMREAYPGKKIHFWYSGRVNTEMRRRFEAGELPKVPPHLPVLVLASHRDMGHHRTVTEDKARYFLDDIHRSVCGHH